MAWIAVFVSVGAAVVSWFTPRPDLDADDAAATALGALDEVDVEGTVEEPVERSQHATADGDELDVWVVFVEVGDETVETRVLVDAGQLVYVDDRIGADRQERLLSDDDFDAVADFRNDATLGDWVAANVGAMVAAALVAVSGYVIAKRSDRLWPAPRTPSNT